jgi:RNA polymerase sigma factor (sigma-70 family)
MKAIPPELSAARERFLELVAELRPNLHRYAARLVGSAIDGEDVVQESLAKAYYAMSQLPELPPLRPWLLRIVHNTAVDFLRRYDRRFVESVPNLDQSVLSPDAAQPEVARAALSSFVALPVLQRSSVIMKDVLDMSLEEIAQALGTTVPAVKAALNRGRTSLRDLPQQDVVPWRDRPETQPAERDLLDRYVALFNARDWDGVQALLTEECRLDLVSKSQRRGRKQVAHYFGNYAREDVRLAVGRAEGRDVIGVYRPGASAGPDYVIALSLEGGGVGLIRDWRYVPYLMGELAFEHNPKNNRVRAK